MITPRKKMEGDIHSAFMGLRTYMPLARGTEKNHLVSVQNYALLCKTRTELSKIMVSLNRGTEILYEAEILTCTTLIRNIFCCFRFEAVMVVLRLRCSGF